MTNCITHLLTSAHSHVQYVPPPSRTDGTTQSSFAVDDIPFIVSMSNRKPRDLANLFAQVYDFDAHLQTALHDAYEDGVFQDFLKNCGELEKKLHSFADKESAKKLASKLFIDRKQLTKQTVLKKTTTIALLLKMHIAVGENVEKCDVWELVVAGYRNAISRLTASDFEKVSQKKYNNPKELSAICTKISRVDVAKSIRYRHLLHNVPGDINRKQANAQQQPIELPDVEKMKEYFFPIELIASVTPSLDYSELCH